MAWGTEAIKHAIFVLGLAGLVIAASAVDAAEFRRRATIRTPAALPADAAPVARITPIDRAVVERFIHKLFAAYGANPAATADLLDDSFVDKSRLLDTMSERLPRDAKLSVLGIGSIRTVSQHIEPGDDGNVLVSVVSATVRSQLVFNDPVTGFSRLEGRGDYFIKIRQKAAVP